MRIGVDVGGTNTDAVLMRGREVIAAAKRPTTGDVTAGLVAAVSDVLASHAPARDALDGVMVGTTHLTNALVERRRLARVGVLRLGLPATTAVEPFEDWPDDLRRAVDGRGRILHGGNEYDGRTLSPLDPAELRAAVRDLVAKGTESIAIAGVFSPVTADTEREAARLIAEAAPHLPITLSHQIGGLGLLERENAAAVNAALQPLARTAVAAIAQGLAELGIQASLYLTQNDGTLMSAEDAASYPVRTFASGPTNSMRGAAFLSGLEDGLVLDVGGTTTDMGALAAGFPRESAVAVSVAGVRTNFRMPDLFSIGLGGGSLVANHAEAIGPRSVGHEITTRALVFGGDELTATDVAVAAGRGEIGDPARVARLDPALVERGMRTIRAMTESAVDAVKLARTPEPMVVVGGGAFLIDTQPPGVSRLIHPRHSEVANAVGAAIAQVSGEVDRMVPAGNGRAAAVDHARNEAIRKAVAAGAEEPSIRIVQMEEIPVAYMEDRAVRVRAKAVGDLAAR
jgi:N-methylhydantoinase A/oxoprolinase/acetone carboxylase beta subunit